MVFIHSLHQHLEDPAVRVILRHVDLLTDDALLFVNRFLRKIGGGNELQQKTQALFKILCAGEVIGSDIVAGKGIGDGAQHGEPLRHIVIRHIEELMLQIMGDARRDSMFYAVNRKFLMDGAEVRHEVAQLFRHAGAGHHCHRQAVLQGVPINGLVKGGIKTLFHHCTPLRK